MEAEAFAKLKTETRAAEEEAIDRRMFRIAQTILKAHDDAEEYEYDVKFCDKPFIGRLRAVVEQSGGEEKAIADIKEYDLTERKNKEKRTLGDTDRHNLRGIGGGAASVSAAKTHLHLLRCSGHQASLKKGRGHDD